MIKHLSIPTYLRCALAVLTAGALFIIGAGIFPATAANPHEKITAIVEDKTVTSETEAGTVGITLPGTSVNQPQVALAEVPQEYLEATSQAPLANTSLPHAAVSSYETKMGTQTLIRIDSAQAAKDYRFPLSLPEETTAHLAEDGGILIKDVKGEILGGYNIPWALDANGKQIPTRFTLEGGTLIQTIDFTAQTAFPVVADPSGFWGWAQCAGAIGTAIATNGFLALRIAKVGGIAKAINLLKNARTKAQLLEAGKYIFGEISSISGIMMKCILS